MRSWRRIFTSPEAEIESKAGASPRDRSLTDEGPREAAFADAARQDFPFDPDVPVWPPEDEALEVPDE